MRLQQERGAVSRKSKIHGQRLEYGDAAPSLPGAQLFIRLSMDYDELHLAVGSVEAGDPSVNICEIRGLQ